MKELPKAYNPAEHEETIFQYWENSGFFKPKNVKGKNPYVVAIPPPNVTGSLHMGHALNNTIQDVMVRWHRMKGDPTLWIPGTDHAGIATQNVVEKQLKKERKSRFDLGRANFNKEAWKWKDEYEARILGQLKTMGCSCDFSRTRFTMDKEYSKAVIKTFKHYYDKGYLYRDYRIINWCPRCNTSLSDLEVEHEERNDYLWYIEYQIEDSNERVTVATTRPETMLGDTAVAVNPKDKRYKHLIGQNVILPIVGRRIPIVADEMVDMKFGTGAVKVTPAHDQNDFDVAERHKLEKIIIINESAKMTKEAGEEFEGMDRYEAREKVIELLKEGKYLIKEEPYTHSVGHCYRCQTVIEPLLSLQWFVSMKELAKPAIKAVKDGEIKFHPKKWEKVYLHWMENIKDWCVSRQIWWGHQIPAWYKGLPSLEQLSAITKTKEERKAGEHDSPVHSKEEKETRFILSVDDLEWVDKVFKEIEVYEYTDFFDGKKRTRVDGDYFTITDKETPRKGVVSKYGKSGLIGNAKACLELRMTAGFSRYEIEIKGKVPARFSKLSPITAIDILEKSAKETADTIYVGNSDPWGSGWERDEDVLDTWFSSALWPFATLGWPEKTADLEKFYPTSLNSTARDIIYLWVARMIMSGYEFTGTKPFSDVYIHATVFNKEGRRMSKSLGTGVDPLGLIEKYGADAMRFGLLWQAAQGQDMKFTEDALNAAKKFANKIWNASRFVMMNLEDYKNVPRGTFEKLATKDDLEIIGKFNKIITKTEKYLEKYDFQHAEETLYEFFWHDYCDEYIEIAKNRIRHESKDKVAAQYALNYVLKGSLKLIHPFMPFVTEVIWQNLEEKEALIVSEWPKAQ